MFGWFKRDPVSQLRKRYKKLMEEAQTLQRHGDIPAFAVKDAEAREVLEEIERLEASASPSSA